MKVNFVSTIAPIIDNTYRIKEVNKYSLDGIKTSKKLYTEGLNTCSAFNLNAGNMNLLGHIKPEGFNPRNFSEAFERIVKNFQDTYGEVKALVLGGRESALRDPHSDTTSNDVYATMCEVLSTKCNIPDEKFASILGKFKDIKSNDDIAIIGDRVFIANKEFEKAGILNSSKENIENTLGNIYEDVIIPREFLA